MQTTVKDEMRALLDRLPEDVTCDRLADAIELRRKIARGPADVEGGRVVSHQEVLRQFGPGDTIDATTSIRTSSWPGERRTQDC
jgi:hypothetical protein